MAQSRNILVEHPEQFFAPGSAVLKLSPSAAVSVCALAAAKAHVIVRVEGGIMHAAGFEARGDCIWDGKDPPLGQSEAEENNDQAAAFVRSESSSHNAFVLTAAPTSGYLHKNENGNL